MQNPTDLQAAGCVDERVTALNFATLGLVDEILWLPFPSVALTTVELLYGSGTMLPEPLLARIGKGAPLSVVSLVTASAPLATLIPSRLASVRVWRDAAEDAREARALARRRYRELQAALVLRTDHAAPGSAGSLVPYVYGVHGRRFHGDAAERILERVVTLNRAAFSLLRAIAERDSLVSVEAFGAWPGSRVVPPPRVLDILAETLPPIAVPDFVRVAGSVTLPPPVLDGEGSIARYRSLFAEMLSLAGPPEVRS